MKFEEILPALREGKKVRISVEEWVYLLGYITLDGNDVVVDKYGKSYELDLSDLIDGRWEIVKESKKIKLRDLTIKHFIAYCHKQTQVNECGRCIFKNVVCNDLYDTCWINHKDLYSDKFLDQEIEIEE